MIYGQQSLDLETIMVLEETLTPYQKMLFWDELKFISTNLRDAVSRRSEELVREKVHQILQKLNELHLPPQDDWDH